MKFVVLADLHYGSQAGSRSLRRGDLAPLLLRRLVARLNRFVKPDALVVLGDLLDDGEAVEAAGQFAELKAILATVQAPLIVLPGNHDGDGRVFADVFGPPAPTIDLSGVRFCTFVDAPAPGWQATRSAEDLARTAAAGEGWGGPVVALQHVPLLPPGDGRCPYNLTNAGAALAAMRQGGVGLAIGGHYHAGLPLRRHGQQSFLVAPAFCEAPFRYLEVEIEAGGRLEVVEQQLQMPAGLPLAESHVHTEMAYCAADITIAGAQAICRDLGLCELAIAEHSGQLHFDRDTFWAAAFMAAGLETERGRVERGDDYLALAARAGIPNARLGFEVDCDFVGRPVLTPAARARAGFLIGAVHWTPESAAKEPYDAVRLAASHRRLWEQFIPCGIDVLAHPFRIFHRHGEPPPRELFGPLARLLRRHGVAAELNFHIQEPVVEFAAVCLEEGVKLSLGSDSHELREVAEFWPHLRLLASLGVGHDDLDRVIWRPGMG